MRPPPVEERIREACCFCTAVSRLPRPQVGIWHHRGCRLLGPCTTVAEALYRVRIEEQTLAMRRAGTLEYGAFARSGKGRLRRRVK